MVTEILKKKKNYWQPAMVDVCEDIQGITPFNFPMTEVQANLGSNLIKRIDKLIKDIPEAQQVVWVHDEIQIECPEDKAEEVGKLAVESIKKTGEHFNLRVPLTGEYKISNDWSGTH